MPRVTWATMTSANPMGQQAYEREIQRGLAVIAGEQWRFDQVHVGSLRTSVPGTRRMPARLYRRAPLAIASLLGAACYRTTGLVHRFDLRIPPSIGPEIITVHDLPPLRYPDEGELPASAAAGARRAQLVLCPSEFAASEVRTLLRVDPDRIRVIPNGLGPEFEAPKPIDDHHLQLMGITEPFVLHAAGATTRKNLGALSAAWRLVVDAVPNVTLVLCGPPDGRRDEAFEGCPSVVMAGLLPPARIAAIMTRAAAVVVPSTYEGFGLPALEGMACGRPVVAAHAGALPEICGAAAVLVEPTAEGLAEGLVLALTDGSLGAKLSKLGPARASMFTWPSAAAAHLDAYRQVLDA